MSPCHLNRQRRGSVSIIIALSLTVLLMFAALAIDLSYMRVKQLEVQNAADAAAHAGMVALVESGNDPEYAAQVAESVISLHGISWLDVDVGAYDFENKEWVESDQNNAIRVTTDTDIDNQLGGDLFLAPALGLRPGNTSVTAISAIQPREIIFVLDQSCSMSSGSKIASAKEGILEALQVVVDSDPNGMDRVALVGYGDAGFMHQDLTNATDNLSTLTGAWDDGICLCTLDPYVNYYSHRYGSRQENADGEVAWKLEPSWGESLSGSGLHPMESGESHYGSEGHADLTFRCCEPHCDEGLEADRPAYGTGDFWDWIDTYSHGNGAYWGLEIAMEEFDANAYQGSHKVIIFLGDGADYCPSGDNADAMGDACDGGSNGLIAATQTLSDQAWSDQKIHVFPIYYGNNSWTREYYASLAQGDGELYNPQTSAELEAVFAEIVARSQITLVE